MNFHYFQDLFHEYEFSKCQTRHRHVTRRRLNPRVIAVLYGSPVTELTQSKYNKNPAPQSAN